MSREQSFGIQLGQLGRVSSQSQLLQPLRFLLYLVASCQKYFDWIGVYLNWLSEIIVCLIPRLDFVWISLTCFLFFVLTWNRG